MLGFYAYLPNITVWLRMQPNFPLKNSLLELDSQTLQLIVFTCLLFLILAKVIRLVYFSFSQLNFFNSSALHRSDYLVLLRVYYSIEHGTKHWNRHYFQ